MLPQFRCSEIASEAILGQKQSCNSSISYMVCGILYPIVGCIFAISQLTSNFNERSYYGWQNSM